MTSPSGSLFSGWNATVAIVVLGVYRRQRLAEPVLDFLFEHVASAIDDERLQKLAAIRPGLQRCWRPVEPTRDYANVTMRSWQMELPSVFTWRDAPLADAGRKNARQRRVAVRAWISLLYFGSLAQKLGSVNRWYVAKLSHARDVWF